MRQTQQLIIIFLICVLPFGAFAADENPPFVSSLKILGGPAFPVGDTAQMFTLGGTGTVSVHHRLKRLPFLNFFVGAGFSGMPLLDQSAGVLFTDISAGAGVEFEILPRFTFEAFISGGGYWGYLTNPEQSDFGGLFTVGAQLGYDITGAFRLGAGAMYRMYPGISDQLVVTANSSFRFDFALDDPFYSAGIEWEPFYSQLAPYYSAGGPLGRVVLTNKGNASWKKIQVRFDIPGVSRGWTVVPAEPVLEFSESMDLALLGDFGIKNRLSGSSDDAEAKVEIGYRYKGWPQEKQLKETLWVKDASFGDNPNTIAVFASSLDPVLSDWAQGARNHGMEITEELNPGLAVAASLYEALGELGFQLDAQGRDSWAQVTSGSPAAEDFPFPRDTLLAASGDRTESAVLLAALLEAVGVPAGLVGIDGVFYPAVFLGEGVERINAEYAEPQYLPIFDGVGWAIFDMDISGDFLGSLKAGAQVVLDAGEGAVLISLRESWEDYPQAGYSRDAVSIDSPASEKLTDKILAAVDSLVRWEIDARRSSLETAIASNPRNIDLLNSLGALLARYGLRDEAADWFDRVLLLEDDSKALVNMANIEFLRDDLTRARTYYNQAYRVDPFNPYVLLGLARVDFEQENFGSSRDAYSKLEFVDPDLADRFDVLTGTGPEALERARTSELRRVVFWLE